MPAKYNEWLKLAPKLFSYFQKQIILYTSRASHMCVCVIQAKGFLLARPSIMEVRVF